MKCRIVFETPRSGAVSVRYGRLLSPAEFKNAVELFVECGEVNLKPGGGSTIVTAGEFSFFLRDVNSGYPVYVPDAGAAALPAEDPFISGTVYGFRHARGMASGNFDQSPGSGA